MSLDETFGIILEAKLAPVRAELNRLNLQVESLRRALPPPLVSMSDAASALGVSLSTIKRRVKDGSLPVRRVGRKLRIDMAALQSPSNAEVIRLAEVAKHG